MKRIIPVFLLAVLITGTAMHVQTKKKIVFFGDSITQMGVNKGGYIDLLKNYVQENGWSKSYELIGAGIGGNKVYDLYLRLEEDVLAKKPTHVLIYVGINDVWHKTSGIGTHITTYEKFYEAMIKKLQQKKIKVLLCSPSVIGEKSDGTNPQDADLEAYSAVVKKLAATYSCALVDLRQAFTAYEKTHNTGNAEKGILTTDKVHLNAKGNELVANAIKEKLFQ